ncbi:hypothetical protein J3454_15570 [Erythrobacter sp. NFXS35]|uniref:hypothetical protein n=1 Tax=Erythrobacter sp. NFXS35 TaxID=2818436 RepID=UPI0032DE73AD
MPEGISDTQRSALDLTVAAITGTGAPGTSFAGQSVDGGDAIVGTNGATASARGLLVAGIASVELVKSVVLRDPFGGTSAVPGTIATFSIAARIIGSGTVNGLIVTDAISDGTTYLPGTLVLDTDTLRDAEDGDAGSASGNAGISVNLGDLSAPVEHSISFDVVID